MKFPEFDNRPGANQPLHHDSSSDWSNIKFPLLVIGLPILMFILFGSAISDLFRLIFL